MGTKITYTSHVHRTKFSQNERLCGNCGDGWRRRRMAATTDSEAKSAVSAFADRAPLLLSSSQFHIKVCSICRMDNFHVPLGKQMTVFIGVVREPQARAVKDSTHSFYNGRLLTVLFVCCVCLICFQGSLDVLHNYMDNCNVRSI